MATEALSYMEDINEFSRLRAHRSTVIDLPEERLDILQREFVRKVENWPTAQRTSQMTPRVWLGSLMDSGDIQSNDEISQSTANKKLVDCVRSWDNVGNLVLRIHFSQLIPYGARISNRLLNLLRAIREEEGENADISADSLRTFFSFLKRHPNIRYPDITLTPDGNVYSRWKGEKGSLFSIEFLPGSKVGYVVFATDPRHPEELIRNSGIDFVDTVFEKINTAFGISAWVLE